MPPIEMLVWDLQMIAEVLRTDVNREISLPRIIMRSAVLDLSTTLCVFQDERRASIFVERERTTERSRVLFTYVEILGISRVLLLPSEGYVIFDTERNYKMMVSQDGGFGLSRWGTTTLDELVYGERPPH